MTGQKIKYSFAPPFLPRRIGPPVQAGCEGAANILLARRAPTIKRTERCPCRPVAPGTEEGMEPDDLLCSRNARWKTPLARANGTSRRASGWVGEKDARNRRSIS